MYVSGVSNRGLVGMGTLVPKIHYGIDLIFNSSVSPIGKPSRAYPQRQRIDPSGMVSGYLSFRYGADCSPQREGYTRASRTHNEHVGREKIERRDQREAAGSKVVLRSRIAC